MINGIINNKLLLLSVKLDKAIEKLCKTYTTQYMKDESSKNSGDGYIEIFCNSDAYGIKLVANSDNYMYLECHSTYSPNSKSIRSVHFITISERVDLLKDILVKKSEYLSYRSSDKKDDFDELIKVICNFAGISQCELEEYNVAQGY